MSLRDAKAAAKLEGTILYESGDYHVTKATFGSGRTWPRSVGYRVWKRGVTCATLVGTVGYPQQDGLDLAKAMVARLQARDRGEV